jgi:diaminopimelate decarboxylase
MAGFATNCGPSKMRSSFKSKAKSWLRGLVAALPPDLIKKIARCSPDRLLAILDHPQIRAKFPIERPLQPSLWDATRNASNRLVICGHDCVSLAERHGTPLIAVDKVRLTESYSSFLKAFSNEYPHVEISYSYKSNPLPGVLQHLHQLGAGAEVVSPNELKLALSLGVDPDKIIYNGPGKTRDGLDLAVSKRIKLINIDGFAEIEAIDQLAGRRGIKQQVAVRVVTSLGWKSKFGFPIHDGSAALAYRRLKQCAHIDPCGIHFHLSTGMEDQRAYGRAVTEMLDLAGKLKAELGIGLRYFDLGGGYNTVSTVRDYRGWEQRLMAKNLPVQEATFRPKLPISACAETIGGLFKNSHAFSADRPPLIILEPGRAVTSASQILLIKVLDIKNRGNGMADVIMDGGKNIAAPLAWECHAVLHASRPNEVPGKFYTLYGPLCTPYDQTFQIKMLPELIPGDILAIMDTGAYFVSMQSPFCSFATPAAVMLEPGACTVIRNRQTFESMFPHDPAVQSSLPGR